MKKAFALLALLALVLCGCTTEAAPEMYIEPAQLSEEEEAVAKLLAAKTVSVRTYELVDGAWELRSGGGGMALKEGEKRGRMAFGFEDLRGSLRKAVQFGDDFFASSHEIPEEETEEKLGRTTSFLSNRT